MALVGFEGRIRLEVDKLYFIQSYIFGQNLTKVDFKWSKTGLQLVSRPVEHILGFFPKDYVVRERF